jgi:choline dehydrogenase
MRGPGDDERVSLAFPTFSNRTSPPRNATRNRAGVVTLRSPDPRDVPSINFRYFEEGNDATGEDLTAIVDGIRFVRGMTAGLRSNGLIVEEELPGDHCQSETELMDFIRDNAWGTGACGTCSIGPTQDPGGVLTSDFRVHGTRGLRVVDASAFPRSPGFYIVSAVYMMGEKAADVILADAARASA